MHAAADDISSLSLAARVLAASTAIAFGICDAGVCLYLPIFSRIFREALPGQDLSFPINIIMPIRWLWIACALLLPIVGAICAVKVRKLSSAIIAASLVVILLAIQSTITWASVISPMLQPLAGTSSAH